MVRPLIGATFELSLWLGSQMKTRCLWRAISCRAAMVSLIGTLLLATLVPARAELTYDTNQAADGTSFLAVAGEFEANDDLARFRETASSHHVRMVGFNSPGGNIAKALELGRLIRAFGLDTVQKKRAECASACALAFMGGVRRIAEAGAIGVHNPRSQIRTRSAPTTPSLPCKTSPQR